MEEEIIEEEKRLKEETEKVKRLIKNSIEEEKSLEIGLSLVFEKEFSEAEKWLKKAGEKGRIVINNMDDIHQGLKEFYNKE